MSKKIAVKVSGLVKSYGETSVLTGVDFEVEQGTMLALLGPNGAGKTTTVRIMSTLLKPDSGSVSIQGHDVVDDPDKVRTVIGLTGQSASVDELLTGRENLIMMGRLYRLTKDSAKARAEELLGDFELLEAANRQAKTYSGGMRRRLDLAVSLIAAPPIIFLDEPTTGLDPRSRLAMWDMIKKLKASGTTILLTTQYLEEADQLADRIVLIDGGKVIAEGTAAELKAKVGKDRLELTFTDSASLAKAKKVIGKKLREAEEKMHTAVMVIEDPRRDVKEILDQLATGDITIESLSVHKPTLDDVFLTLTGKTKPTEKESNKHE